MREAPRITALFLDIGGVLLTDGWNRESRRLAAQKFELDLPEMDERHHLTFDTYEEGKLSLDEYLARLVFYEPRSFTPEAFKAFMFSRSQPFPVMIDLIRDLKRRYGLKVAAVSNEGRELTEYRIRQFNLDALIDVFVSSCFVHYRKPDADIYRMALDMTQAKADQVAYVEDRALFVQVANGLGIHGVAHRDVASTRRALAELGLVPAERAQLAGGC
jgi:putative hydrolase of the HAD superfamily